MRKEAKEKKENPTSLKQTIRFYTQNIEYVTPFMHLQATCVCVCVCVCVRAHACACCIYVSRRKRVKENVRKKQSTSLQWKIL